MVGRIPERDIAEIRDRARIEEIVGDYVTLRPAGPGSMKGLCPFHSENTPSFHVRPSHGYFHCFGCGEGGDVISFLQKYEHIPFVEAVQQLADRVGYTINFEGGAPGPHVDRGTRMRLVAANAAAQRFYAEQLQSPDAEAARKYLADRDFDAAAAQLYGCGYAPSGWDTMTKALLRQGFEFKELEAAGLSRMGQRGPIDRFHRRLLWPIRNLAGEVIGFGARKLYDDDNLGKYMNTPETMLYKKSQVLFGVDQAKKHIARGHQVVVVEGYTDVMAMHASGVETAVASCGTAFGDDHLALVRRLMMDDSYFRGEIIYTFDGDEAGKAAALKAFDGEQKVAGQTFVAVAPDGMDPCELRQQRGEGAVRDLIARRIPMFEFAVKALLGEFDLDTAEGRVHALRRTVPVVARIKDVALRDEYARQLAGWVGWEEVPQVLRRVREEAARNRRSGGAPSARVDSRGPGRDVGGRPISQRRDDRGSAGAWGPTEVPGAPPSGVGGLASAGNQAPSGPPRPDPHDPALWAQREALKSALQVPAMAGPVFDALTTDCFTHPAYVAVRIAIENAGGTAAGLGGAEWVDTVGRHVDGGVLERLVSELAVEALPVGEDAMPRFVQGTLARVQAAWVGVQIADLKSKLRRMSPNSDQDYNRLFGDLVALEAYYRSLNEQANGEAEF
ncbi:DNA primase [Tsukamurella sp. 8F]|uniref:DNA primase n=1 Tax=unclassified Tsukamurella TaxID=2633480 RepID=UPI0023B8F80E|nr:MULTISPECIES: DNA primase [unclassified Tsukamurella]MDF0529993.1 DNA primase [Tsukamurella sp. 8J]MDF0587235.1 DNA primase [Tsukamurella sp. 8F]